MDLPKSSDGTSGFRRLSHWADQRAIPESAVIMFTALIVGIGAGLGAVVFRRLIQAMQTLAYGGLAGLLATIAPFHLLIIPAIGGAIFGPLIYWFAREAKGHGVPEVMEAVALRGGRIRPRVVLIKALASSICIGTGGSVGREGPIAQIGAAFGSTVGQWLNLSDERVRSLVACGTAGGVAATFNAPIAGSIFALEVILGQFRTVNFGAVVISAVIADVIAHTFEGNLRTFSIPEYTLVSPWELVFYIVLGALAAVLSVGFSRLLYLSEDLCNAIPLPESVKPILGGVLLGGLGIVTFQLDGFPRVFGVGYESIDEALFGKLAVQVTLGLLFLKMIATCLTLGAGGSGGVFAPSLFMGAMFGSTFGQMVHRLFPTITAPSGAYAMVGMAAFFSGASHAPITAILILFEMTGNYPIILPLMLATVMSTLIARIISSESIYTLKLTRRGVHLQEGQDIDVMQGVTVGEAMTTDVEVVPLNMPLEELAEKFERTHHHGFPVVDIKGRLSGVVSIRDLERAQMRGGPIEGKAVADIATTEGLLVAYPYEPISQALRRLGVHDVSRLPVVEKEGSRRLVGVVRRGDIIRAYQRAILKRARHQHQVEIFRLDKLDGAKFVQIDIPPQSPVVGKRIIELHLPSECLIVSVRRGRKLHVAHGYTVLQAGDRVTVFADQNTVPQVRQQLMGELPANAGDSGQRVRHRELTIFAGASCIGKTIQQLPLPPDCILVRIHRGNEVIVPHGNTVLQVGDIVELFGAEAELREAELCLTREI
jgi:chloride channel protein, CIC family